MRQIFHKYITIFLIFCAFYFGIVPLLISKMLPGICENISKSSEYTVKIENPKFIISIIPTAQLKSDSLYIKIKNDNTDVLISQPNIKIRILPLLSGKLHINKIYADDINLNIFLKKNFELDRDFVEQLSTLPLKVDCIKINKYKLSTYSDINTKPVLLSGENFIYKKNGRYFKINIESDLNIEDKISKIKTYIYLPKNTNAKNTDINIDISNFNLSPLNDFFKQYLPKDMLLIKGIVDIHVNKTKLDAVFSNFGILMSDSAKSIIFPNILDINSKFEITETKIIFDELKMNSKNIHLLGNGTITDFLDLKLGRINMNFQLDKSKVEDIIDMLPPLITEDFNVYKLKFYKFYGNAMANFSVKGDFFEPSITGDAYIDNGVLIKPIPNTPGAIVKLKFAGKYLYYDVYVPATNGQKVWVKGGVEIYNVKYADMRVWSTKNVDLELAESKVVPIHEILNFVIGPVPIMDIKGTGNIDITVKGNRKSPHVWGTLNFYDVKTFFNEIPNMVLTKAKATLDFDDENAVFKTQEGLVNNIPIDIQGTCNLAGRFDFNVKSQNQDIDYLYNAIKTSTMLEELKRMIPNIDKCLGKINLQLKVYGNIKDINDLKYNKNFFTSGVIELLGNTFGINNYEIKNTKGTINYNNTSANIKATSTIGNSIMDANISVKNDIADVNIQIPRLNIKDILSKPNKFQQEVCDIICQISAKYKGKIEPIELNKLNLSAKITEVGKNNKLQLSPAQIIIKNNKLNISGLRGHLTDTKSSFDIDLSVNSLSDFPKSNVDGSINLVSFELPSLNMVRQYNLIPPKYDIIKFDRGKINTKIKIHNNKINSYMDLGGVWLTYIPMELPIKIVNGSLIVRNNSLKLNKINLSADNMPILLDGTINDIFNKQNFEMYINSKINQEFVDKYFNKNKIYPVKLKGELGITSKIKGIKDNFDFYSQLYLPKEASIYHLGATVGDIENALSWNINAKITNNILKLKEFSYDKLISSQNGKETRLNMLKSNGTITLLPGDVMFDSLHVKTSHPTDARIFNIIFRKPNIKQGQFTSDLHFNGKLSNPKINGTFHIFETNIPFLDTTMKNITMLFKDRTIDISSFGEVLGNDVKISAVLKNKLTKPYYVESANLYTKVLDLNHIINLLKLSQVDNYQALENFEGTDISAIVIKNLRMSANNIYLRNISAENFEANASWSDKKILKVDNFKFNIANGTLRGNFVNNLPKNKIDIDLKAKDINANDLAYAVFDLNNQIYGDLTGNLKLACIGINYENCMKTLDGDVSFNVKDGKMPKLGSLEYLLRAGNLLKGGLTSLSINSVIDIITPLKTGDFSDIYGTINIKNGIANDISISSVGKSLNLFMSGTYNFSTAIAEMEVLGMLSKKISTMFGPLGNVSLNTMLNKIPGIDLTSDSYLLEKINKIPGIEFSSKAYRKFLARIKGDINGDNYVTTFEWIN